MSKKNPCVQCGKLCKGTHCGECFRIKGTLDHIDRIEQQFNSPIQEIIQDLYFNQRKTYTEVCSIFGLQYRTFRKVMIHLGLHLRTRSNSVKLQWERDDGTRAEIASKNMCNVMETLDFSGDNNPAKRPEVRAKISKVKKLHNPGLIIGRRKLFRMKRENIPNSIERAMMEGLDRAGVDYEREYRVWKYCLDFALVSCKVAIECDGVYWHSLNPEKDIRRDAKLGGFGWVTYRFTGDEIRDDVDDCVHQVITDLKSQNVKIPMKKKRSGTDGLS